MFSPLQSQNFSALADLTNYHVQFDGKTCIVEGLQDAKSEVLFLASVDGNENQILLSVQSLLPVKFPQKLLASVFDYLFSHQSVLQKISLRSAEHQLLEKLQSVQFAADELSWSRSSFYQNPSLWHHKGIFDTHPENWIESQNHRHPERRILKTGVHYKRYIPHLKKTLTLRTADAEKDLDLFHNWHNQPRVSKLWDLNWGKPELKDYLEKGLKDRHQIPFIVELDQEAVGYFEVYWVAEDRLAPYYESDPFDRGFHFLIGNKKFLGAENTQAIVSAVMHYMFLDDPRTRRIMAEPRADNQLVLKYVELIPGWKFIKEFDFPHKRAALLMAKREDFFAEAL